MRKMVLLGAVFASATILLADSSVQPLNVKPGLWEVTMNIKIVGMEAPPQTNTYRSCLKKEDLNKYPFSDPDKKCTYTVLSSTGSTMEARGTCAPGEGTKIDFKLRLDSIDTENVKGTGQMTMSTGDMTINGNYTATSKWISATCPADVK